MENFQQKFIEEATDLINDLEAALLSLESTPEDVKITEQVFRIMHSLKGSGAMFGFDKISDFTHHLESVYDYVRNGKIRIDKKLLTLTLQAVDHLKRLLANAPDDHTLEVDHEHLLDHVISVVEEIEKEQQAPTHEQNLKDPLAMPTQERQDAGKRKLNTYYLYFEPKPDILDNGTNPFYLLDELHTLGHCVVIPHTDRVPTLEELNSMACYTYWELILVSEHSSNTISDVFIFVEDECTLEIKQLAQRDLIADAGFVERLSHLYYNTGKTDPNSLLDDNLVVSEQSSPQSLKEKVRQARQKGNSDNKNNTKENNINSIRVSSEKLDHLMNLVSELVTTQARLSLYAEQSSNNTDLMAIAEDVAKLSRQLRDNAFDICLIPIENMVTRFRRLVRDLSVEMNKEIDFHTEGTETELDKTIIENLVDPIMHIIRNSIDHGIESIERRRELGKPDTGQITLSAFYSGTNVNIRIKDDGAGLNKTAIREKAIQKSLISNEQILTEKEIYNLILLPGFSTAKVVTDVSGRGVGMDVVKRKIDQVRGDIEIEAEENIGTTITIKLPLTLSIIDGLLVRVNETFFVIPLSVVDKIYEAQHKQLINIYNNLIIFDGHQLPFLYLRQEFDMPENTSGEREQVIVVNYEDKRIGLAVDTVIGEYQAVLKPLGKHYKDLDIISGATILGDGTVALVMDTNKIVKTFTEQSEIMEGKHHG